MFVKDGWNGWKKRKEKEFVRGEARRSWHCFNSGREWKCLYIFTIGGQGLKNKVKEKLSKFRDDRNGRRIIVGRRRRKFWVSAHKGWLKAEDEVRKVQGNGKFESGRERNFRVILSYCFERVCKFKYTRRKKYRREIIQFSPNGYFKMHISEKEGRKKKIEKYESSSTKSYTLHEFLEKFGCLVYSCIVVPLFFLFVYIANLTV